MTRDAALQAVETVRKALWAGLPAASGLLFVAVAIKVFRAAHMETSTTVAIVKSADVVALTKGVVVTLLPGFLTSLIALVVWLWVSAMPKVGESTENAASEALIGPNACLLWIVLAIGFFTVPFVVFLLIFLPVAAMVCIVIGGWWASSRRRTLFEYTRKSMVALSLVTAVASTGWLAISSDVWLPLRTVAIADGHHIAVGDKVYEHQIAAYILESDADQVTLLVNDPRAVVTISTRDIEPYPAICIPGPSSVRWLLVRTSQTLKVDGDYPSPYPRCPEAS